MIFKVFHRAYMIGDEYYDFVISEVGKLFRAFKANMIDNI